MNLRIAIIVDGLIMLHTVYYTIRRFIILYILGKCNSIALAQLSYNRVEFIMSHVSYVKIVEYLVFF